MPPEKCPTIPKISGDLDEHAIWDARMIDEYTRCAAKVDSLHE